MLREHLVGLWAPARRRVSVTAGVAVIAVGIAIPGIAAMSTRQPGRQVLVSPPVSVNHVASEPVVEAPLPSPTTAAAGAPSVVHLPFLGTGFRAATGPAASARPGSLISVPAVGLQVGVIDYTDCSGDTAMTRTSAVHFTCTPNRVTTMIGHNPGVFTPLTRAHTGDRVHYQHDGVDDAWTISEIHRVSPQEAAAYSQDNSYTHAVLATCAEPDSSAYWILIALPDGATHASGGAQASAAQPASGGSQAAPAPAPSPTPTPAGGTTLPGGITIPPPPPH